MQANALYTLGQRDGRSCAEQKRAASARAKAGSLLSCTKNGKYRCRIAVTMGAGPLRWLELLHLCGLCLEAISRSQTEANSLPPFQHVYLENRQF